MYTRPQIPRDEELGTKWLHKQREDSIIGLIGKWLGRHFTESVLLPAYDKKFGCIDLRRNTSVYSIQLLWIMAQLRFLVPNSECLEKVWRKSLKSLEKVLKKSRKSWESWKSLGKVLKKSRESSEKLQRKSRESREKVERKSRVSPEKVLRKSWESRFYASMLKLITWTDIFCLHILP